MPGHRCGPAADHHLHSCRETIYAALRVPGFRSVGLQPLLRHSPRILGAARITFRSSAISGGSLQSLRHCQPAARPLFARLRLTAVLCPRLFPDQPGLFLRAPSPATWIVRRISSRRVRYRVTDLPFASLLRSGRAQYSFIASHPLAEVLGLRPWRTPLDASAKRPGITPGALEQALHRPWPTQGSQQAARP